MSAGTSEFFCLICFLVCSCTAQTAYLGQNVTLPCKFTSNKHNNVTLVQWRRIDLGPDSFILLYKDGRFHPDKQLPSYKDRVYLQDMETRDFSLILMNVTMEDRGRYECDFIEEGRHETSRTTSTTTLEVVEPGDKDGGNTAGVIGGHLGVVCLILLHILVSAVFF
ncbi:hyaluronan and proteoglycan link protein 1-like [Acanthochromis polyacanthus]|uniref:hyaluronan and proteoglycan link protein 1-like n=1 Tax=Acanthochromis polyacanthus TaxID=80966 RepID=UPI002234E00C|nr:hyaluronan and proteoglycan link protein 1-like [Acanthochromis polyacanthus]